VLQYAAVQCSMLLTVQCGAVRCSVAVCCSVMQCAAVCCIQCSVVQCGALRCSALQCLAVCCSVLRCVAVCRSVLCMSQNHQISFEITPYFGTISQERSGNLGILLSVAKIRKAEREPAMLCSTHKHARTHTRTNAQIHTYEHTFTYTYKERERERERNKGPTIAPQKTQDGMANAVQQHVDAVTCTHTHTHTHTHTCGSHYCATEETPRWDQQCRATTRRRTKARVDTHTQTHTHT